MSRTAAVYSEDSLLFVVGNKVGLAGFVCRPCRVLEGGKEGLYLNTSRPLLKAHVSLRQMFKVPSLGPGCAHFQTCSTCLMAPRFMTCGWCSGVCSRQHECKSKWSTGSCAPVITEVGFQLSPWATRTGHNATSLTAPTSPSAVLPQSCAGGRGDGGDAVRVGLPVSSAARHHQRQNSQHCGGIHCLCRPAREEQQ